MEGLNATCLDFILWEATDGLKVLMRMVFSEDC